MYMTHHSSRMAPWYVIRSFCVSACKQWPRLLIGHVDVEQMQHEMSSRAAFAGGSTRCGHLVLHFGAAPATRTYPVYSSAVAREARARTPPLPDRA